MRLGPVSRGSRTRYIFSYLSGAGGLVILSTVMSRMRWRRVRRGRRKRAYASWIGLAVMLLHLVSPVAKAGGYLIHGAVSADVRPTSVAVSSHNHCASTVRLPAGHDPSPVHHQLSKSCEHCDNGACCAPGCASVLMGVGVVAMPSRNVLFPRQAVHAAPAYIVESLYRPPIAL